jgi:hypothetical protein
MREIENRVLNRALQMLDAIKCEYAVVDADGNQHGELQIKPKKAEKPKRPLKYEWGSLTNHVRPLVQNMKIGEVVVVPIAPFDLASVQGLIGSCCFKLWGKGNHTACLTKDRLAIEVLKLGDNNSHIPASQIKIQPVKTEAEKQDELFQAWLK